MAKLRSPNYPSLTLREALERTKKVYEHEHMRPAPKEVILKDLGFAGANGASLTVFGALRRYGLLQPHGDGFRVGSHAITVFELAEGDAQRNLALQSLAFTPTLFAELKAEYGFAMPSEHNLRFNLVNKGFTSKAADEVVRVYRENLELVETLKTDYNEGEWDSPMVPIADNRTQTERLPATVQLPVAAGTANLNSTAIRQDVFSLSEGPVTIQWPATLSQESYQDISDWLEILRRKIGRSVKVGE